LLLPESKHFSRNSIAISLWSERGLIGALILAEKVNGSLFTQEEIEIARMVGERLIDSKASMELTHKLMDLQRQQIAQTRLVDQHTRRALHDDILPRLQSAMIKLSSKAISTDDAVRDMGEIHRQLSAVMRELPSLPEPEVARRGLIEALQVTIDNEYRPFFSSLTWKIADRAYEVVGSIPPYALDVLYHATREAVRNAARHGRQSASGHPINLAILIDWDGRLTIRVQDDGSGFDPSFLDGKNMGQGLALHSTLMAVVGGSLSVERIAGKTTQVILRLPG
jgi:signal transduction histidine kinase